jgi:hypothetical protein
MKRFIIILAWFAVSIFLKIPSLINILTALVIIIVSLSFLVFERSGFALRLLTYAYGVLVIGALGYLLEVFDEEK